MNRRPFHQAHRDPRAYEQFPATVDGLRPQARRKSRWQAWDDLLAVAVVNIVAIFFIAHLLAANIPCVSAAGSEAWPGGELVRRDPPCYAEGWAPGDRWGPGPSDFIPLNAVPCPEPTGDVGDAITGTPAPAVTLPPTDTR